ncbi:hypothetical protein SEPCBS119000_000860 [Sporothrix epigloea]|uniref:Uncharacterized protein n=1 Tax=Sporothrix epigloea TaxID=1892477 RepID=A0ABP0DAP4_9PEZI
MGYQSAVVSPVRCDALLSYVLARCTHPTTIIICSTSGDFVERCSRGEYGEREDGSGPQRTASLLEVAVARHIRVAFVPTVAHLRGYLAAFDLAASRVPAPPKIPTPDLKINSSSGSNSGRQSVNRGDRALLVYGFVGLHRGTSEWSGQGLGASVAVLVEAGWRTGLNVLVVESGNEDAQHETVLDEKAPVLSLTARKQMQRAGYPLRSERVRVVLQRWLTFRQQLDEEDTEARSREQDESTRAGTKAVVCGNELGLQRASPDLAGGDKGARDENAKITNELQSTRPVTGDEKDVEGAGLVAPRLQRTFVRDSEDEDSALDDEPDQIDSTV